MSQIIAQPSKQQATDSIHIDFGKGMSIKGITNIAESNDKQIIAILGGNTLTIVGDGLNIDMLNIAEGIADISGSVGQLKYSKGREKLSFIKKLIK